MIEPTERLLWAVVGVFIVGVMGFAVPVIGDGAPVLLIILVIVSAVDAIRAGSPADVDVVRRVSGDDRPSLVEGRWGRFVLELRAKRPMQVDVTDTVAFVEPAWFSASVDVGADDVVSVEARRRCLRRGDAGLGRFTVRTLGPMGLVRRRQRRDGRGDAVVIGVDVAAVASAAERIVRGGDNAGSRRKRAVERGRELESLRDYRRGDDVRLVDWKASARRGSLIVKDLVPETRQDVVVVVDAGRQLLGLGQSGRTRLDEALSAALLVCAAAIDKGDRDGVVVLDDDIRAWVPPREGRAQLARVADSLVLAEAVAVEPAYQELSALLIQRQKKRALVVVVTDVVDEAGARALARAVSTMRGRHLAMIVAIADPPSVETSACDPTAPDPLAPYLADAAAVLMRHRRRALAALEASGAVVIDAVATRAGAAAVDAYLGLKARGRL